MILAKTYKVHSLEAICIQQLEAVVYNGCITVMHDVYRKVSIWRTRFKNMSWDFGLGLEVSCGVGRNYTLHSLCSVAWSPIMIFFIDTYTEVFKVFGIYQFHIFKFYDGLKLCAIFVFIPILDHRFGFGKVHFEDYFLEHLVEERKEWDLQRNCC